MQHFKLVIAGKAAEIGRHADIHNPSTGEIVGRMPIAIVAEVELAIASAKASFPAWVAKTSAERSDAIAAIAAKIEANAEELARLLTLEQGKPLGGLGSRFEIGGAVAWTHVIPPRSICQWRCCRIHRRGAWNCIASRSALSPPSRRGTGR